MKGACRGVWIMGGGLAGLLAAGAAMHVVVGRDLVRRAYRGDGPGWLTGVMSGRDTHPVSHYLADADRLAAGVLAGAGLVGVMTMALAWPLAGRPVWRWVVASFLAERRSVGRGVRRWLRREPVDVAVLLGLMVAGAWLRAGYMDQAIRFDEALTVTKYAAEPTWFLMSSAYYPNNHLFHTWLVRLCWLVWGSEPWAVRLPAMVAGVLLIPATYGVARRLYGGAAALLAAGLVMSSSILIEFSANARGYTWLLLWTLASLGIADRVRRRPGAFAWGVLAMVTAMGFLTMPTMLFPAGVTFVWLAASALMGDTAIRPARFLRQLAMAGAWAAALTVLLYLPVLVGSGWHAIVANRFVQPLPWATYLAELPGHLSQLWEQWNRDVPWWLRWTAAASAVAATLLSGRAARHRAPLAVAVLLWVVPVAAWQRSIYISPRVWLFLLPMYLMLVAAGVAMLGREAWRRCGMGMAPWGRPVAAALATIALATVMSMNVERSGSVLASEETGVSPAAGPIAMVLRELSQPGDRLVASDETLVPLIFYFNRYGMRVDYASGVGRETVHRLVIVVDESRGETAEELTRRRLGAVVPEHAARRTRAVTAVGPLRVVLLPVVRDEPATAERSARGGG